MIVHKCKEGASSRVTPTLVLNCCKGRTDIQTDRYINQHQTKSHKIISVMHSHPKESDRKTLSQGHMVAIKEVQLTLEKSFGRRVSYAESE
jgi:hypothetical protein